MVELIKEYELFRLNQQLYTEEERKLIRTDFRERLDSMMLQNL